MKPLFALAGMIAVAGCMEPVASVTGAVPFAQVLADTQGRPYECVDYDAATNSCTSLSRFRQVGPNAFVMTNQSRVAEDVPDLQLTVTLVERNGVLCTNYSDAVIQSTRGQESFAMEAAFADLENTLAEGEPFCGSYIATEEGYIFRVVSGSPATMEDPIQNIRFFASPKRLRVRE